ncbi:MAG: M48 family metallopeptidase [Candidatus Margulisbacteria bacterium]|jgi:predicted metal-dependent hydrolase|nr:M48 family metallopeptidase [Candidatus Margulisiibacteriota bacterium]
MLITTSGTPVLVHKSRRARQIRLCITPRREVKLTLPWYMPLSAGQAVVREKEGWITEILAKLPPPINYAPEDIARHKTAVWQPIAALAEEYAVKYGVHFQNIKIKDQATRWGSCSRLGNLNFNWRLALVPEDIRRYVVIHEICHLKEMNHSRRFWALVAQYYPDYKKARKWLRDNRGKLM